MQHVIQSADSTVQKCTGPSFPEVEVIEGQGTHLRGLSIPATAALSLVGFPGPGIGFMEAVGGHGVRRFWRDMYSIAQTGVKVVPHATVQG